MWKTKGQSITDRLLAARYTLTGQDVAKSVCKATTDEAIAPKKKHLDYLVYCTNKPNVQISELVNVLIERSRSASWVVVFKALITTHYILIHGNERFLHCLASSTNTLELNHFMDRHNAYGYAMSPYIRRYAEYLNRRISAYRTVVSDFCRVQCGSALAIMSDDDLLETLTLVQDVLDALLQCGCSSDDLSNGIIVVAVNLLFRDLIRLFAFYNEGVINILRRYFEMKKKQCQDALVVYKKFLTRLEWIPGFIKICETTGFSTGDFSDLRNAPDSLLDTLTQHLSSLETEKQSADNACSRASSAFALRTKRSSGRQSSTHLRNKSLVPQETCDFSHSSFLASLGNEPYAQPKTNCPLDISEKLDVIYDDPLKLIRNPFVSVKHLSAKPALSPTAVCSYYATATNPSYVTPSFVSDEDFSAVFQQSEENNPSRATVGVRAIQDIREVNFSEMKDNFCLDRCRSAASPHMNALRNASQWWPQQLSSTTNPGYIPMCPQVHHLWRPASSPNHSNRQTTP